MNSGIYLKSIFDVITDDKDLELYVQDLDKNKETLKALFSKIPQRATEFSAGYDLAVLNDEVIPAHESRSVSFGTSILIENPAVTAVIVPRSSLAKKKGLIIAGGPVYVYSGTGVSCICHKFINYSDKDVVLKKGDKIAQVVFLKYPSWIIGGIDAICDMDQADVRKLLPDPLDETFMSPLFTGNLEPISCWNGEGLATYIDQSDRVSYYFQSPKDVCLTPGKVTCIMTGIRCNVAAGQVFLLKNAFKSPCVELANAIGVIDADYYDNADNGGEIGVLLLNRGNLPIKVKSGDVIASGAIYFYEKADGDVYGGKRTGGFGSTDRK